MKKIICPTDFSETANNAIEYAAKLAQKLNTELEIVNVQLLPVIYPVISGTIARGRNSEIPITLEKICTEVNRAFNISCNYSIETTTRTLEKVIGEKSVESQLIVMGTNGKDDLYQYIFGTNTHQVIRESNCPVLVIPDGVMYSTIKKIVFAWDYSKDNKVSFLQLKNLMEPYTPEIIFLHISSHKSMISDDVFRAFKEEVCTYFDEKEQIVFDRIYSEKPDTFVNRIDEYMTDSKADLLAVTYYDRGALKNIFHGTVVKELSEVAQYPLLVLHV